MIEIYRLHVIEGKHVRAVIKCACGVGGTRYFRISVPLVDHEQLHGVVEPTHVLKELEVVWYLT